jgi:hypothetical protein
MSEFTTCEKPYTTSACVFGPVTEELTIGPCVNEEYIEPNIEIEIELSDEKINEILHKMLKDEEEMYDEMIAADRLKDADYYESEERIMRELQEEIEREEDRMAEIDRISSLYNRW